VDSRTKGGNDERNVEAAITCITPMPQCVYTGDEDGGVVSTTFSI
jgi:beige protein homolog 1